MGRYQLWVVIAAVSEDEMNWEWGGGGEGVRTVPLGLRFPLCKARRRVPELPSPEGGRGGVSGDQGGDGVTVFQEGLGYVSVRVMRVQEAGLQLGYVWG